jgi:hypothetical protein
MVHLKIDGQLGKCQRAGTKTGAHMHIRVSGHEKNHKPTRKEWVRHHPKKSSQLFLWVYVYTATGQRNHSLTRVDDWL